MVRAKQKKKSLVVKKKGEKSLLGIGLLHDLLWWGKTRLYYIKSHKIPCAMQRFRVGNPPIWHGIWKGIRRGNYLDSYSGKPLIKSILKIKKRKLRSSVCTVHHKLYGDKQPFILKLISTVTLEQGSQTRGPQVICSLRMQTRGPARYQSLMFVRSASFSHKTFFFCLGKTTSIKK